MSFKIEKLPYLSSSLPHSSESEKKKKKEGVLYL